MIEARAQLQPWSKRIEIALLEYSGDHCYKAPALEMVKHEEGMPITPAFALGPKAVQQLMDDLWRCGYRPSEGEGSAGQLSSVKYHLEDMRRLLFDSKGKP
jgi:hypothetical protein